MIPYPKINSIFKRDKKTHKFTKEFSRPEFEYLQNNAWEYTEKVDGMNIRVIWKPLYNNSIPKFHVSFVGRTNKAEIPTHLFNKLQEIFPVEKFKKEYPETEMCLYGEGYGVKIQKGGKYISYGVDFILFDIGINGFWLSRKNIEDIANKLEIKVVPIIGEGTLHEAIRMTKKGVTSTFGNFIMEGFVLRPKVDLLFQNGNRVITKIKHKDFQ